MSWASHPTNEMPPSMVNSGRHRRGRSRVIVLSVAATLLALAGAGVLFAPGLLGGSSQPRDNAAQAPSPDATTTGSLSLSVSSSVPVLPLSAPLPTSAGTPASSTATAGASSAGVAPSKRSITSTSPPPGIPSLEDEVVRLTNEQRTAKGCTALRLDTKLRTAARAHTAEMASRQELTHTGADGSDPGTRMQQAGYNTGGGWAENVAAGYPTPEAVITGWMNSEGHRDNILNCSLKAIGVGAARASNGQLYWTQDFGGR